ncbi:hypothetical protein BDQ17DRAFT_1541591 [Cyathus striatus]|nr:hypothetical protein BDQ17DRAFT_1541591 [Cyathus striatus]
MPVRVLGLFRRRPDITHEQFIEYWLKHPEIINSLPVVQRNIIRYTQFHVLPQETKEMTPPGHPIAPYDGMSEMIADSLEDFKEMITSEGYLKIASPDEDRFLDKTSMTVLVVEAHVMHERAST